MISPRFRPSSQRWLLPCLAAACLLPVYMYLVYFAVQPMPPALVARQVIFDMTVVVLVSLGVAFVYRRPDAGLAR